MTVADSGDKLPVFNVDRVLRLRDKLTNETLVGFYGSRPIGQDFEGLVGSVCAVIKRAKTRAVYDSLRHLAGQFLTPQVIFQNAWRLAGNVSKLANNCVVPPWSTQLEVEWVPAQVLSYSPVKTRERKEAGLFTLQIMSGSPCALIIEKMWPAGYCRLLSRHIGYSSSYRSKPFLHPAEMVSMRLALLIEPSLTRQRRPGFDRVQCPSGLLKWNTSIIKSRRRIGWSCPRNYQHQCYQCHVGYIDCPAAVRRDTIELPQTEGVQDAGSTLTETGTGRQEIPRTE